MPTLKTAACPVKSEFLCQTEKSGKLLELYKDSETFPPHRTASQLDVLRWAYCLLRNAEYCKGKLHSATQMFQVLI